MGFFCSACGNDLGQLERAQVGRAATCSACKSDLHVCLNCKFYDTSAYNSCKEPQADRVVDKNRSNFCDYFHFKELGKAPVARGPGKADHMKKLDDLFKK